MCLLAIKIHMPTLLKISHLRWVWLGTLFFLCSLFGCTNDEFVQINEVAKYPYFLETAQLVWGGGEYQPIDLDGNGNDEIVRTSELSTREGLGSSVQFRLLGEQIIDQVNFDITLEKKLFFADWDQDDKLETIVSVLRGDSLFIRVLDVSMTDRRVTAGPEFFITSGQSRNREGQVFAWDPYIASIHIEQAGRASDEFHLITSVITGQAGMPRGLFKHQLSTGERLDSLHIGSPPYILAIEDVDQDGQLEIVVSTQGTDNEVSANGFSDENAYFIVIDLETFSVEWFEKIGHRIAYPSFHRADLDGDGRTEFVFKVHSNDASEVGRTLKVVDFDTQQIHRIKTFDAPIASFVAVNLDQNATDELLVLDRNSSLHIIDHTQHVVKTMAIDAELKSPYLHSTTDADGDGVDEIIVHTTVGDLFLGPDLTPKAIYQYSLMGNNNKSPKWEIIKTGIGSQPLLSLVFNGNTVVYRLVRNSSYWWNRYGSSVGWGFGIFLFFMTTTVGIRYILLNQRVEVEKKRIKDHRALQEHISSFLLHTSGTTKPFLEQVRSIMRKHASDETFTVKDLAEKLGLSERHALRKLKALTGMTPTEFLWQYRLHHAAELLRDSALNKTIAEIAFDTGFKDAAHMSRRFKQVFNTSPTQYRVSGGSS